MLFISFLFGIFVSLGIALSIIASSVDKSNNYGDTKPGIFDFSNRGLVLTRQKNGCRRNEPLDHVEAREPTFPK